MKKLFLIALAVCTAVQTYAQDENTKIRRSSLYTIQLTVPDDNPEHKSALEVMQSVYDQIPMPSAYNDFRLSTRHIDFSKLPEATQEEIDKYNSKKAGAALGKFAGAAAGTSSPLLSAGPSAAEYIARIDKYLANEKVANALVAKWHNKKGTPEGSYDWDNNLEVIAEYGLVGLTEEDKAMINENNGSLVSAAQSCENDLVSNTYVVVNRYSFLSGKELFEELSAPLVAQLAGANPLVAVGIQKTLDIMKKKYVTGYFVRCHAYLFQLEAFDMTDFWTKYENPKSFAVANYKLNYLGKSEGRARARKADDGNVLALAMQRATDKCYADLQHDFEQFRPFYMLHDIEGQLGSYIGTKEGVTEKTAFDVYESKYVLDKKTNVTRQELKKVGSLKVEKNGVWDNNVGEGEDDPEESVEVPALDARTFTLFKGKPGKLNEGHMIRLAK